MSEELYKIYIYTFVTLVLTIVGATMLFGGLRTVTEVDVKNSVLQIAGVINLMQTSDADSMRYDVPTLRSCSIEITEKFVKVTATSGDNVYEREVAVIDRSNTLTETALSCDGSLRIDKSRNTISVT